MADTKQSAAPSIIEGMVKFRDGKKWKSRWCVMRKLSPVAEEAAEVYKNRGGWKYVISAYPHCGTEVIICISTISTFVNNLDRKTALSLDCVHLQLYKDHKERQKNGQTKASLSLQRFIGFESGFTLDKESNTLAVLCEDLVPVLAFDTGEILLQWRVKVQHNLGSSREFSATVISAPSGSRMRAGPVRLHARAAALAAVAGRPPALHVLWDLKLLRRYGVVEGRLCIEGGSRCGRGEGLFVFAAERARELVDLLSTAASGEAGSRMSIASRPGSVLDKRFPDTSFDDCCRSVSPSPAPPAPAWHLPLSRTHTCIADGHWPAGTSSLPRSNSCIGKFPPSVSRSSNMATTPGAMSLLSPGWMLDNITEKRSDSDRTSIYSRSSGSASEYSVPRGGCLVDKSFDSKRASPVACCTPTVPEKMGVCQCWQQKCSCRKKFNGPYENYDVPKTPMPLIQEHPTDIHSSDPNHLYDTPKRLTRCLADSTESCPCTPKLQSPDLKPFDDQQNLEPEDHDLESHSNYVNISPPAEKIPKDKYINSDLSATLEKFETSLQILRSAGFSQEELDALEEMPENEDDISTASSITVHPSTECFHNHPNYLHMEPLDNISKACSDTVSRISHISDPSMQHSEFDNALNYQRPSSADFIKRIDPDIYSTNSHRDLSLPANGLRASCKSECINDVCDNCHAKDEKSLNIPDMKSEISFVARFRESVRIRRSSSVPSKSDKNRDSSSSNDSGVSTGSLKHHKCDFSDFEPPTKCRKSGKCLKNRQSTSPPEMAIFVKSNSSDPLKNVTFHFEEVATMTKSNSCDVDTLTRRNKPKGDTEGNRISQMTNQSTSSGASDLSDYMESLSMSSYSSYDASEQSRQITRPRSGKEYLSIDRALLVGACNIDPQV